MRLYNAVLSVYVIRDGRLPGIRRMAQNGFIVSIVTAVASRDEDAVIPTEGPLNRRQSQTITLILKNGDENSTGDNKTFRMLTKR